MRWVFVGVIALNLLYLGWQLAAAEEALPVEQEGITSVAKKFPSTLRLLAERAERVSPPAVVADARPVEGCPAVGPFANDADADRVAKSLAAHHIDSSAVRIGRVGAPLYWVYLPPLSTRQGAMRKLRELQAKGIDSFVVTEGADMNAISLGSFASHDSALGVRSRMYASGYEVGIREQTQDIRQVWVVLADPHAQGFAEFVPADLQANARLERQDCPHTR